MVAGRSATLPGLRQTVPRAEIQAAIFCLNHSAPSDEHKVFELYTDCKILVQGWGAGIRSCLTGANSDLWHLFWEAVDAFPGQVRVLKVKAHMTEADSAMPLAG